jgi:hypothetical protein
MPNLPNRNNISLSDALKTAHPTVPVPETLERRIAKKAEKHDATFHTNRRRATFIKVGVGAIVFGSAMVTIAPRAHIAWEFRQMAQAMRSAKTIHRINEGQVKDEHGIWTEQRSETWEYQGKIYSYSNQRVESLTTKLGIWQRYPHWQFSTFSSTLPAMPIIKQLEKTSSFLWNFSTINAFSISEIKKSINSNPYSGFVFADNNATSEVILWMNKKTNLLTFQEKKVKQFGENNWTKMEQTTLEYNAPLSSEVPLGDTLPAVRMVNIEQEREKWLLAHQKPLIEKKGIQILDVQVNKLGDVFVIFDAPTEITNFNIGSSLPQAQGYICRRDFVHPNEETYFEPSTYVITDDKTQQKTYSGLIKQKRGLQGGWFPVTKTLNIKKPYTLYFGAGNQKFEFRVTKPTCDLVPEYMPLLANFPGSPAEFMRQRSAMRVDHFKNMQFGAG